MKKLTDIQISATPNAQKSSVKIDGVAVTGMVKITLIVECDQPTILLLEGFETDAKGNVQIESIEGHVTVKRFQRKYFGGSIRIQGAAPDERQCP